MGNEEANQVLDNYIKGKDTMKEQLVKAIKVIQSDLYEANNRINGLLDIVKQKDKIIDDMAEHLTTSVHSKEWIIEYYKKRCEDAKD